MPSLFRFLMIVGTLVAVGYGSLYVLAHYFEPKEVRKSLPSVKIRKE